MWDILTIEVDNRWLKLLLSLLGSSVLLDEDDSAAGLLLFHALYRLSGGGLRFFSISYCSTI